MGYFEKNSKIKEHLEIISEEVRESVFSFIPAGPIFNSLFNYGAKLQHKRIADFASSVKSALEDLVGEELSFNFETEDFVDVLKLVMHYVQSTKSELKLERFKNILVKHIIEPANNYEVQTYLRLLDELNDVEIIMLDIVQNANPKIKQDTFPIALAWYNREKPIVDIGIQESVNLRIGNSDVSISDSQIVYLENGLLNKGLIRQSLESNPNYLELKTTEHLAEKAQEYLKVNQEGKHYELTLFGKSFLDYLKSL